MSSNNQDDNNKIIARKTLVNLLGKTILTRNQKRKLNKLLDDYSSDNSPPPAFIQMTNINTIITA